MADITIVERLGGVRIETGAHRPFPMDDPERVYFVEQGHLDIFTVEFRASETAGRRRFVARVPAGEIAFGAQRIAVPDKPDRSFGFLAVPSQDAVVVEGARSGVASENFDLASVSWIDEWVSCLSEFLVLDRPPPRDALLLEADPDVPYPAGTILCGQHRVVIWISADAPMRLIGRQDLTVAEGARLFPVTERTWVEIDRDAHVSGVYSPTALLQRRLLPALDHFARIVLAFAMKADAEAAEASQARRRDAQDARRESVSQALRDFGEVMGAVGRGAGADSAARTPLQAAATLVAASCGATLEASGSWRDEPASVETIEALARRSGIRTRFITLTAGWWRRDGPSLVSFTAGSDRDEKPLALLSDGRDGYRAVDPETGTSFRVTRRKASRIASGGVAFYPPLPDVVDSGGSALGFSLHGRGRDLRTLLVVGVMGGLAALVAPVLTGEILVRIIPRADIPLWLAALAALLLVAFSATVFDIVRGLALLRIEGRVDERLQSAVWNRLLSLPAPFFRDYTAGDLADRANGISEIRQMLTGAAVQAAMGGIFSIFSFGLLFYYSQSLALYVSGLLLVLTGATWLLARNQLRHHRTAFHARGAINGFVFQMIGGLPKIRVANAENYALARWAERFAKQRKATLAARRWAAGQHAVISMFQPLSLVVIFAMVHQALLHADDKSSLDLAGFLSFNAAFVQLAVAVIALATAATTIAGVFPLVERVRPILEAQPESSGAGIDPGDLTGDIEFANVTFRYQPDSPNALHGVSFHIRQGEYVAFVGSSGSGKSTLYRLLLGFERPYSGTVFLDGHDLSSLDPTTVRRRMGVVLQEVETVAGTIYENIAGMSQVSADQVWAAAQAAALEDDIRAMPMGLGTMLPEGGVGLSAGQRQRLLIARALVRKPRVVLFDEATSALDNRTQAVVQESLKKLGATRLVIAHRLSSIRGVDRIYVLDAGRIVESGGYDDLIERGGVFATLCRRQLVQT